MKALLTIAIVFLSLNAMAQADSSITFPSTSMFVKYEPPQYRYDTTAIKILVSDSLDRVFVMNAFVVKATQLSGGWTVFTPIPNVYLNEKKERLSNLILWLRDEKR